MLLERLDLDLVVLQLLLELERRPLYLVAFLLELDAIVGRLAHLQAKLLARVAMRLVSNDSVLELPLDISFTGEELLKGDDFAPGTKYLSTLGLDCDFDLVELDVILAALSFDLDV